VLLRLLAVTWGYRRARRSCTPTSALVRALEGRSEYLLHPDPAYGRDYTARKAIVADLNAGKDFIFSKWGHADDGRLANWSRWPMRSDARAAS